MDNPCYITDISLPHRDEYATQKLCEDALCECGCCAHMSAKKGQQARETTSLEVECLWALLIALKDLILLIIPAVFFYTVLFEQVYPVWVKPGVSLDAVQNKILKKLFFPLDPNSALVDELEAQFKVRPRNAAYTANPQKHCIMGFAHAQDSLFVGLSLILPVMLTFKRCRVKKFTYGYLDTLRDEIKRLPSMMTGQINWVPRKTMDCVGAVHALVIGLGDVEDGYDNNDERTTFIQGIHN